MKNLLFILLSLFLLSACHESLEDRAARECKEFTETSCPTPVVDNTRTDSMVCETATRTLHYYYTLSGRADNAALIEGKEGALRESLLQALRNSTELKAYKDAAFGFAYTYRSQSNPKVILFQTTFSEKDYN